MRVWRVPITVYVACEVDPTSGDAIFNAIQRLEGDLDGYPGLVFPVVQAETARPATMQDNDVEPYLEAFQDCILDIQPEVLP